MQRIVEYPERALQFGRLAAEETDPEIKAHFEKQAAAYCKIAVNRAKALGLELPKMSN